MSAVTNQLFSNLAQIASRSNIGLIVWVQSSPTIFQWDQGNGLVASIQKAAGSNAKVLSAGIVSAAIMSAGFTDSLKSQSDEQYLFQVVKKDENNTVMSLSSRERPELKDALKSIYEAAQGSMDSSANAILNKLLS
ncbi:MULTISPECIES: hypothetical protein [Pseudomonas]|uniref:hypothetical protein n=1 Tax=Pseudomonas TaxID=286 RepID=UPI001112EBBD|nr:MULTISPECIES: hypothetical protein [Pseudomonas]